ncbi:hypothetical protein JKF63_05424 [Porcisia hertigi]|uniref:EF-hand domain-containing protein n=1 Tax=Porcisia hertigi TaxID=2761500 RepID=A0A836IA24_9TRYP|nr:hypothetical protein JKF63_05424 [Porcisia hertigi]
MGQAASYAESSVQRALLRLKEEEQADEDEILCACGYSRATPASCANGTTTAAAAAPTPRGTPQRGSSPLLANRSADAPLPPPPDFLGPLVSLTPEYYTLDELRDALRYLPDTLWVSLHRVSLLYMLDNDHDGRINATDISFFMDWGIKTVGRDVLPDQLAEVLQTCASLHCWRRCLHVGERIESGKAAATAQPRPGHGTDAGSSGSAYRQRISSSSAVGWSGSTWSAHRRHQQHDSAGMSSFMLLHFRGAFLKAPAGGPAPLPGTKGIAATESSEGAVSPTQSSPMFASPRSVVTKPVTDSVRHAAAVHFAEWMLRLVQHQERDRRDERRLFECRVRSMAATADVRLSNAARLRHSPYSAHQSLRLRLSTTFLSTGAASADASGDGDDAVVSVSQGSIQYHNPSMLYATPNRDAGVVAESSHAEDTAPERGVAGLASPAEETTALSVKAGPMAGLTARPHHPESAAPSAALETCANAPLPPPFPSRSSTPLRVPMNPSSGGGVGASKGTPPSASTSSLAADARTPLQTRAVGPPSPADLEEPRVATLPPQETLSPHQPRRLCQSVVAPSTWSVSPGGQPNVAHSTAAITPEDLSVGAGARVSGVDASGEEYLSGSGLSNLKRKVSSSPVASAASAGTGAFATARGSGIPAASLSAHQMNVLLMDSEAFYAELEASRWCTIGAVEEVYLDFAVEESYCMPFWSFCRLLNEASADEVQAALELPTDQAVAVLTSALAVEEYRRAAARRQLQRHVALQRDGLHGNSSNHQSRLHGGSWARGLKVIPLFVVSQYTFVAFVTAFIHAYWAMLESMGVDPAMQPAMVESISLPPTRSPSAGCGAR